MPRRYPTLKLILSGLILVGAVVAYLILGPSATVVKPVADAGAQPSVPVGVAKARVQDLPLFLTGLGNVMPLYQVAVHSQVDGQLVKVAFREGQDVRAGDLLAQIDPRTYQAALDQALAKKAQDEALLANAKLDEKRYQDLVDRNFISRQQLDTTRSQVAQYAAAVKGDAAAIENARVLLGYTTIRSPIAGRVGLRQVDPGNIVHASDPGAIVLVTQLHPIAVLFTLPEDQVARVLKAEGAGALEVTALSRDGAEVLDRGHLELVDNQIDPTTAMVKLKAILPNDKGQLWPGLFVNASLKVDVVKAAVTIPVAAVQRGQTGAYVWTVGASGQASERAVEVGPISQGVAVITKGVADGETVVTSGHYRLRPGIKLDARPDADGSSAGAQ